MTIEENIVEYVKSRGSATTKQIDEHLLNIGYKNPHAASFMALLYRDGFLDRKGGSGFPRKPYIYTFKKTYDKNEAETHTRSAVEKIINDAAEEVLILVPMGDNQTAELTIPQAKRVYNTLKGLFG